MTSAGDKNRVAAALQYLRSQNRYFRFDAKERVVEVAVSEATDVEEVAAHIGSLRDLEKLTFYRTDVTDRAFCYLSGLAALKELSIDGLGPTSAGLAHLGSMSQLEDLYIENARDFDLAAFACIARVPNLQRLSLARGCFGDADLEPLSALVNLEELSFSENPKLQGTFCDYFVGLTRLRHLSIGELDGEVTDEGLASIAKLPGLVTLYVTGSFTDDGLGHLSALHNLTTLGIQSEHLTAEGIGVVAELPKLNCLSFDAPRLGDDGIAALRRCSTLDELSFRCSALSDVGLQRLRDNLPKCSVRDLQRDPYEFGPAVEPGRCSERHRLKSKTPFLTLLVKGSDYDLVDGTFDKIIARHRYRVDVSEYSPVERVIMLIWESARMIDGGGLDYFFTQEFEGDPDFRITAGAYKTVGLLRAYEAFQEAFALFPGGKVPHDPAQRDRLYQAANRSARDRLTRKLWQDERDGSREKQLADYIRRNASQLGDLDAAS